MPYLVTYTIARQTGCHKNKYDRRNYRIAGVQKPVELPESFVLDDPFPVKDQNGFGSCTAQATAGHKQMQEGIELSARFIYAMTKKLEGNTNWGATTANAFKVLCKIGAVAEKDYPEKHDITELAYLDWNKVSPDLIDKAGEHKSLKYWFCYGAEDIKQTVFQQKQAVVISVPWYNSYNHSASGYLALDEAEGWKYGHAMRVIGWDKEYLVIKNSWGADWGLNGICYFHKNYPIWDGLVSLDMPEKLPVENRYGLIRTWNTYLKEKAMIGYWTPKLKRLPSSNEVNASVYGKWDAMTIFKGTNGDVWLHKTKTTAIVDGFDYKYVPYK